MTARSKALTANLTLTEKLGIFMLSGQLRGIPRLNIKSFRWDATDIEGVDDQVFKYNNTCFPHAIGLGATFDLDLIREVSTVTATEARALERLYYDSSDGAQLYATSFDGGPLANVAYDPRVGRTSEMYGEDPYHVSMIGGTAMLALQNRTVRTAGGDYFLQTSQVTRHFVTDHGSSPDNQAGNYSADLQSLADEYFPPFQAFQGWAQAEGVMFSISACARMGQSV